MTTRIRWVTAAVVAMALAAGCTGDDGDDAAAVSGDAVETRSGGARSGGGGDAGSGGAAADASGDGSARSGAQPYAADELAAAPPGPVIEAPPLPGPVRTVDDAQSTFGLDVDGGSYTRARSNLQQGYLPYAPDLRSEEFVNYFDMAYADPESGDGVFAIRVDGGPTGDGRTVLRVGLQARRSEQDARKRAVLTFVIDVSGSMAEPGKLELVKESLPELVDALKPDDQVAIVVYSDNSRVLLPATPVEQRDAIQAAIASITSEGSTNAEAGLRLGYETARASFVAGATNRVILASDGLANQGDTSPEGILDDVREQAGKGIQLLTLGFGYGAYNDPLMERLADQGDGFYAFVDGPREAQRLFRENLTSTLETIALDAKIQVTFDPRAVETYRLLGYDNRAIADEQFTDDTVDGGEIGTGHSVTALYEVDLADGVGPGEALGTVALRWKEPESLAVQTLEREMQRADVADSYEGADARFRLAVTAARFAEALREPARAELEDVRRQAEAVASALPDDNDVRELVDLVGKAAALAPA